MAGLLDFGTDEEKKQNLGLLGLLVGSGILSGNQPGATTGQALGQGVNQGVTGLMQMKQQQGVDQMRALQMQKLKTDMDRQNKWQTMFSPQAAPQAGPGVPPLATPQQGAPGAPPQPAGPMANIPPNLMPFIGTLGPEAGSKFMAEYLGKREPTEAWVDEELKGVPGQRNKLTNAWKPLDPTTTKVALNPNFNLSPGQTAEQKEVGEYYGKTYTQLQTDAMKARSQSTQLDNLGSLLDKTYTGTGGAAVLDLKKAAKSMGFDIDGVGEAEAGQALSRQMALELRNPAGGAGMPGAMSEGDRKFLESMTPGLSTTPEGRKTLIETYKKVNQRTTEVAKMARDYRKKHGQIDEGFFDDLQTYSDKNQLFKAAPKAPVVRIRLDENGNEIQ